MITIGTDTLIGSRCVHAHMRAIVTTIGAFVDVCKAGRPHTLAHITTTHTHTHTGGTYVHTRYCTSVRTNTVSAVVFQEVACSAPAVEGPRHIDTELATCVRAKKTLIHVYVASSRQYTIMYIFI